MKVKLYTAHMSACNILQDKLDRSHIDYIMIDDISEISKAAKEYNIDTMPFIVAEGTPMQFSEAMAWLNGGAK